MNYELLTEGTGLKSCVYDAVSGVGRREDERSIFKSLLESRRIDYYICPHCVYIITMQEYDILFKDLNRLKKVGNKIFFRTVKGEMIEVNKQNFSVKCYLKEPNCPEAWVQIYKPNKH